MEKLNLNCGPKTEEGKSVSRLNAITHGLTSKLISKFDEDINFDILKEELNKDSCLDDIIGEIYLDEIVFSYIELVRVRKTEKNLIDSIINPPSTMKKYKDSVAGEKYKNEFKDHKLKHAEWESEAYKIDLLPFKQLPEPQLPIEPEFEIIDNPGEVPIFNNESLLLLAGPISRYHQEAQNRLYRAIREFNKYKATKEVKYIRTDQ